MTILLETHPLEHYSTSDEARCGRAYCLSRSTYNTDFVSFYSTHYIYIKHDTFFIYISLFFFYSLLSLYFLLFRLSSTASIFGTRSAVSFFISDHFRFGFTVRSPISDHQLYSLLFFSSFLPLHSPPTLSSNYRQLSTTTQALRFDNKGFMVYGYWMD